MKRKRSHIGCLFWVALILLVIVVFLFNRPKIDQVLKTTGLTTLLTKKPAQPSAPSVKRSPLVETKPEITVQPGAPNGPGSSSTPGSPSKTVGTPAKPTTGQGPISGTNKRSTRSSENVSPSTSPPASNTPSKVRTRNFDLYFVKVRADGRTVLAATPQRIEFVDSPLTKTFDSLLQGVSSNDRSNGLRSLIPEGTKLLSASVRGGTAYLDFNDRFRFNPYGVQGYDAQLKQVVYTATQFQSVKRVQILLDGKVKRFLASEGIPINKPLDRSSFRS